MHKQANSTIIHLILKGGKPSWMLKRLGFPVIFIQCAVACVSTTFTGARGAREGMKAQRSGISVGGCVPGGLVANKERRLADREHDSGAGCSVGGGARRGDAQRARA
ncbi:hypothetical protein Dimus_013421 [Dionaea muscipula]